MHAQAESHVSLDRFDAADNIDLATIVQEFEEFHEMKFGRRPKLVRRVGPEDRGGGAETTGTGGMATAYPQQHVHLFRHLLPKPLSSQLSQGYPPRPGFHPSSPGPAPRRVVQVHLRQPPVRDLMTAALGAQASEYRDAIKFSLG